MSVPSKPQLTGYLDPSAFYSLSLQSHDPSAFFIEANDIVFQSRFAMLYPIYPCLAIPRLLDCFHDLLVLSLRVEFFRGQGRDFRIVLYEFAKLVFRKALLAYIHVCRGVKRLPVVAAYSLMAYFSHSISSSQAQKVRQTQTCSTDPPSAT